MRIGFFTSIDLGGSPLICGLERGFRELGHEVEDYRGGGNYALIVVCNQSAHTTAYIYPDFPNDRVPIAFLDCAEYGYHRRLPEVVHQYANTFSPGALKHDTKSEKQQLRLRRFLEGKSFPYFIREFSKYVNFPQGYHPIDYPLYHTSTCYEKPNREEYLRRSMDLFMSWGESHPWRVNLKDVLRTCPVKSDIRAIGENDTPRMPQGEYFQRTREAKCSVSFDGYGSGSFRLTEVLCRTLLLQGPLSIHCRAPLVDGATCIEYTIQNDGEKFLGTNICDKLMGAISDPERSFRIYQNGYDHCMTHLTEKATAAYFLDVVMKHDWSKPTQLDL